ncbi:MAG: nucleotidyltransferase substrate binding protein [Oscillospiraceae bacterium]|nr:nucleotidyltransferase substrate binding protein [Oscillospiraceae bacterium]
MNNQDIRWEQRFSNLSKACALLSEIHGYELERTLPIIREGFIQRFEITFDLSWKTLKDYLDYLGHNVQPSPRPVIKDAFSASLIKDGQVFIDMLDARNLMSHTYDEETFSKIFLQIKQEFEPALHTLCEFLRSKLV